MFRDGPSLPQGPTSSSGFGGVGQTRQFEVSINYFLRVNVSENIVADSQKRAR